MDKFFNDAIQQSFKSSYKIKIGAVIVQKNKIVGKGFNISYSTGNPHGDGIHAEISAINHTTAKFRKNSTIVVGRLNKKGELAMSKPCHACETVLKKLGIKKVWYSIPNGWDKMIL